MLGLKAYGASISHCLKKLVAKSMAHLMKNHAWKSVFRWFSKSVVLLKMLT
jgi:hypothetical protein